MKIIFSRKSMDSSWGGMPSPIIKMEDNSYKIFPFPIPSDENKSSTKYSDIFLFKDYSMWDFIKSNKPNFENQYGKFCHLDPDLLKDSLTSRSKNWEIGFGQDHIAQSHLEKQKVRSGDIFLFFGWFQFAEYNKGEYKFIRNEEFPDGFHLVYAYMQIEKIHTIKNGYPESLKNHPHAMFHKNYKEHSQRNNTIYTATENLNPGNLIIEGCNYFSYHDKSILTKRGQKYRTFWELPKDFHPDYGVEITYNKPHRWLKKNESSILDSAKRGQEFVCISDPNKTVENWVFELIKKHR